MKYVGVQLCASFGVEHWCIHAFCVVLQTILGTFHGHHSPMTTMKPIKSFVKVKQGLDDSHPMKGYLRWSRICNVSAVLDSMGRESIMMFMLILDGIHFPRCRTPASGLLLLCTRFGNLPEDGTIIYAPDFLFAHASIFWLK
jgi:hypothetical protein